MSTYKPQTLKHRIKAFLPIAGIIIGLNFVSDKFNLFFYISILTGALLYFLIEGIYINLRQNKQDKVYSFTKFCLIWIPLLILIPSIFIDDYFAKFFPGMFIGVFIYAGLVDTKSWSEIRKERKQYKEMAKVKG